MQASRPRTPDLQTCWTGDWQTAAGISNNSTSCLAARWRILQGINGHLPLIKVPSPPLPFFSGKFNNVLQLLTYCFNTTDLPWSPNFINTLNL